ncbi:MAG: hypothetical protein ACRCXB_35180 [Aeromonadaceae bacterium]
MSKSTRVRVSDKMVRVVRYIHNKGSVSVGEIYTGTGSFFPTDRAAAMCLWNMARLGLLVRQARVKGNGVVRFSLSNGMRGEINDGAGGDRRMKEIAERMKTLKPIKANG